ncbi:MAG: hypothetical protein V3W34_19090 [Phycisphaerae bacterium]
MNRSRIVRVLPRRGWTMAAVANAVCLTGLLAGCDAFNPAFVDFVSSNFPAAAIVPRGPDSRGHVVVAFRNDTLFDERLLLSLIDNGMNPSLVDDPELRPRVTVRVRITFVNGETLDVEFRDGSSKIVEPGVVSSDFPDLIRTEQDNLVVQCDVSQVELLELPSIFVPATFKTFQIREIVTGDIAFLECQETAGDPPHFELLQRDGVDATGNTTIERNFDVRDVPGAAIAPNCGSVVTIVLRGRLTIPVLTDVICPPALGVLDTDAQRRSRFPGEFALEIAVR